MRSLIIRLTLLTLVVTCATPALAADGEKPKPDPEKNFKRLDKDGDGFLTLTEFIGKRTGEKAEKAKKAFARKDKNEDEKLDFEEFKPKPKKKA